MSEEAKAPVVLEKRVSFQRHSDWFNPGVANCRVIVIGCGAVGSNAALLAAKMGFMNFDLWDNDIVEPHNLPNQAYTAQHVGMSKVDALEEVLMTFNPEISVFKHQEFFTPESKIPEGGPLVLATDSFDSRRVVGAAFRMNPSIQGVFETRLGFDYGQVNLVENLDSKQVDDWLKTLGSDKDTPEGPCNRKICATLVGITTAYLVHQMCDRFVEEAKGNEWDISDRKRTLFQMNPALMVQSLGRRKVAVEEEAPAAPAAVAASPA